MKKIFTLMAAALMSVAMMAGANDLLWDFTEKVPSGSPLAADNNPNVMLTYGGYVDDGVKDKNNHLNGIKLNSSGYCYFTKAAVEGKLKLTFGARSGSNKASLEIFTWEGETAAATTSIATTAEVTDLQTITIDLTAEQNNIYIKRLLNTETVLTKIEFKENVARTFVDFEMVMCNMAEEYDFSTLPSGVTASGTFNSDQHGYRGFTITVPVDGTVKFTLGDCQFGNQPIPVKNKAGETIATLAYPKSGCYGPNTADKVFPYIYLGAADTLTFGPIQYCNYFKAEAAELTPCEVIYKDQNGAELGRFPTYEGAKLEAIPYGENDLPAIGEGNAFRGWFYTSGKKAKVGDAVNGNTTISAKVTPIETVTIGSVQTYDFTKETFYPEDHETVTVNGGAYYNSHGWYFNANGSIDVAVAGNAVVVVTLCQYSESGDVRVMDSEQEVGVYSVVKNETPDGTELTAKYTGGATTLTINWDAKQYIHKVVVYNVLNFVEKDEATGYIMVPAGDAASFLMAMVQAEAGDKIFLPNGVYDLGETVLTTISKNNISIIGQSMEGVIIKNAPDYKTESIDKTATIRIAKNVTGTYLQDLTIQNALDYYKNNNGRAVALWDQGTQTICKNVRLLSYQDTYYSNLQKAVKYFEDCEIHGTVDFICGDGSVYFKNNLLYCEKRNANGGGQDALTASNADALDHGYVFEGCTIKSECPIVSFGRAWNGTPQVAFLNTLVDYEAGEFSFSDGNKIQRWTKELMNAGAWPQFVEYNTHLADGTVLTPASNEVTFVDTKSGNTTQTLETVISADGAAFRTMEETLGEWAATAAAAATQKRMNVYYEATEKLLEWNETEEGVYMVCLSDVPFITTSTYMYLDNIDWDDVIAKFHEMYGDNIAPTGGYYVRFANGRGGFGPAVYPGEEPEGIENTEASNSQVRKIFRNGQVVIVRGEKEYNVLGAEL